MVIRKIDGGSAVTGVTGAEGPTRPVAGFGDVAGAGVDSVQDKPVGEAVVERAVADVVARLREGSLPDPAARVDAVIARVVELRLGEGVRPAVVKASVEEAQIALGGHPAFIAHVHALIERAMSGVD